MNEALMTRTDINLNNRDTVSPAYAESAYRSVEDCDQFVDVISQCLSPFSTQIQNEAGFLSDLKLFRLGQVAFADVGVNRQIQVKVGKLDDCYLINIPLLGKCTFNGATANLKPCSSLALIQNVGDSFHMDLKTAECGNARILVVRIDKFLLTEYACKMFDQGDRAPLKFNSELSLLDNEGRNLWRHMNYVWGELNRNNSLFETQLVATEIQNCLLSTLLMATDNNLVKKDQPRTRCRPAQVKRVEEYIHANLSQAVSAADLAQAAGVSASTLFFNFKKAHGVTPMHYLKNLRMERVHGELLSAAPKRTTVTQAALKWGFAHPSRFAEEYRRIYYETPSETLRR